MRVRSVFRCGARLATSSTATTATSPASSSTVHGEHSTQHAFRTRDITLRVPSKDHLLRISFCSTRHLLAETIRRHDLLRSTGAHLDFLQLLGTQLTLTNLLAASLEGEERVETRFTAEEATILTEALALGECRCYLRPEYNAQLQAQGLPTFPLRVNRILYRQEKPFSSLVHADLAELLQQPQPSATTTTSGEDGEAALPFSLFEPGLAARVPLEAWHRFFAYNGSVHAYNFLRRSDACVPAVWLHAAIDGAALQRGGLVHADGTAVVPAPATDAPEDAHVRQRALRRAVSHSFGVIVTPLAAGAAMDRRVSALNRALMAAAAQLYAPPSASTASGGAAPVGTASPLAPLLAHCAETHTACQHLLSLVSGDHEGAHAAAVAARQYSADPATVAAVVDPLRRALGVADLTVPLSAGEAVRTGLDFFCRCSKQNILGSLVSAPASALTSLRESGSVVHCAFCGRQHTIDEADWSALEAKRAGAKP